MKLFSLFRKKYIYLILLILLAAGGGIWFFKREPMRKTEEKNAAAPDRIYTVKKNDLVLGVVLTGTVNAKKKHKLAMEAPWSTKLIKVADENKNVKKGECVAEYETYDLTLKIEDLKVNLENRKRDLAITQNETEILRSSNDADIRTARDSVAEAEDAYNKYWKLEGPRDRDEKTLKVDEAAKELQDAEDALAEKQQTFNSTVFSGEEAEKKAQKELLSLTQKRDSAKIKHDSAILERKIFKRYTHPSKLKELRNKLEQANLNLRKTIVKTQSSMAQKQNQIHQHETQIRKFERDLEKHQSYLPMMKLYAPVDGIVVYGDPDRRWGNPEVKVGMDARRRQVIITIPDMTQKIVDVNLPEQYRSRVSKGNRVIITPDSIPSIKLNGKIVKIASLPVRMVMWDESSPKIYRTTADFIGDDPRLVSGMSVQVEVVSRIIKNVLVIPVEAVFEENGKTLVYKVTYDGYEKVFIRIGESNNNFVEVKEGLEEGDRIFLYRPFKTSAGGV